jgi:hypothetical protein
MRRIIIGFIALFSIISCSSDKKENTLMSQEEFIELLVDIHKTDALLLASRNRAFIARKDFENFYKGMFEKHNITRKEFDSVFDFYSQDYKNFEKIYDEVFARLQKMEDTLKHTK